MAAKQGIPIYTNLSDLFGSLGVSLKHVERWHDLAAEFERRFGKKPTYISRAPGRVNLIGEHIDYALFGVLPTAIERDILIACAPRDAASSLPHHSPGSVIADNMHTKYTRQIFAPSQLSDGNASHAEAWRLDIDTKELRWESYVKAGYYGVLNHHFAPANLSDNDEIQQPVAVDLLVTGSVPAGSGLSSSAAMVVASTLAFLAVNGKLENAATASGNALLNKGDLVRISMENEKRVGVNSGGMDQAASVMSDPSSALYISFHPELKAEPVRLPPGAVFIVANSLVVSDKAVTAKRRYNLRVVETLVAARILARSLGLDVGEKARVTLRQVVGLSAGEKEGEDIGVVSLMGALKRIQQELDILKPKNQDNEDELGVTMEEMIGLTGLAPDVFYDVYLSWVEIEATHFQLYQRAAHVFGEALRVLEFRDACLEVDNLSKLGQLMNESHFSCSTLFDCSCPELDQLTHLARTAGAYGSRLTGAGWGGCTVSLVAESEVDTFIRKIRETYPPYKDLDGETLNEVIFATKPSSGACVYKVE
ncbi:hypothetical protein K443DRAFT_680961 [Laccaria amethystina LaAM-08-1]|uniref:Galactokinase n=1 Tax=Laccaria amethystina LaAM-08-1 TaxID=1095629 RepID=A0A0C9XQ82_9AGAR|nr:hypothetical protein K443DRAFT_680961 [Laccaria amethystina LaAM-08-1]